MPPFHLYLSTIPEALIASMLPPAEFGAYLATGRQQRTQGEAMFFSLDPAAVGEPYDLAAAQSRCVPDADGEPKRSLYLGVYRVIERVPLSAVQQLHLATRDGRVLTLPPAAVPAQFPGRYHLYEELGPVYPLVVSALAPPAFARFMGDPENPLHVPRLCFTELDMGELGERPAAAIAAAPAPPPFDHLRDCLLELESHLKTTKTVDRAHRPRGWAGQFRNGFFLGDRQGLLYFPFPTRTELETRHRDWWRSASV